MTHYIVILDAGSQYGKVIDRKVRHLSVNTQIHPLDVSIEKFVQDDNCRGFIISGGPSSVNDSDSPICDPLLWNQGKPILGICYGMQLMNKVHGGCVGPVDHREDGQKRVAVKLSSPLFSTLTDCEQMVLLTHGDSITKVASGFEVVAMSGTVVAALQHEEKKMFSVQFHPEVDLTPNGLIMLRNFVCDICKSVQMFSIYNREKQAIEDIQARVNSEASIICLVSGGVDSTVCAALLSKAIPDQSKIICIHVNHGFMREQESELVKESLELLGLKVYVANVFDSFLEAQTKIRDSKTGRELYTTQKLSEVIEPEEKRKIIGDKFIELVQNIISEHKLDATNTYLAQGTLRPDLIESASNIASTKSDVIKTHHNDTYLVRELRALKRVIEPLCDYHKDEVRELGRSMQLPEELVQRQPFPGPGLAIRILCCNGPYLTENYSTIQDKLSSIVQGEYSHPTLAEFQVMLKQMKLRATLLPVRTVGVQGDARTYSYAVVLSNSYSELNEVPFKTLQKIAALIPQICHDINRITFLLCSQSEKPTFQITPTLLNSSNIQKLRAADAVANKALVKHSLTHKISQMPVVLIPVDFDTPSSIVPTKHSIVLRPFLTHDFMTGQPALPGSSELPLHAVQDIIDGIEQLKGISRILIDLTSKPPGTTEWE